MTSRQAVPQAERHEAFLESWEAESVLFTAIIIIIIVVAHGLSLYGVHHNGWPFWYPVGTFWQGKNPFTSKGWNTLQNSS